MAHDVFISHSSKDKKTADAACACLESRGIRCWVAPRDIVAGADWSESIVDGIQGAKAMLLILSSHSNISKQVLREIERAANRGIPILPFRIEDVELSKSLQYFLSSAHWIDAFQGPLKQHVERLAENVAVILQRQVAVRPMPAPTPSSRSSRSVVVLWSAVTACLLAVIGGVIAWNRSARTGPAAAAVDADAIDGTTPRLGIRTRDMLPAVAKKIGSSDATAYVTAVHPRQVSGVQRGDVVLRFRDKPIGSSQDLKQHLSDLSLGRTYPLTVLRNGQPHELKTQPVPLKDGDQDKLEEKTFGELRSFERPAGMVILSRIAVADNALASIDSGGNAYAWKDMDSGTPPVSVGPRTFSAVAANSRDKSFIFGDAKSGELVSWSPGLSAITDTLVGSPTVSIIDLFVTDDGQRAVAIDKKAGVTVWNLNERKVAATLALNEAAQQQGLGLLWLEIHPGDFSLSGNGRHLGQTTPVAYIVWDLEKGTTAQVIDPDNRITAGLLSPDATMAAIGTENGSVEVWDVVEGRKRATLRRHTGEVSGLVFLSPHFLVTASSDGKDGSILIWDLRDRSLAWGFEDVFSGKSGMRGPQALALRRSSGTLLSGIKLIRELSLPADLAEVLRQERWETDAVNILLSGTKTGGRSASTGKSESTVKVTASDGQTRDVIESADKSQMITERDASGKTLAMRYVPAPDSCGLGIRMVLAGKDETESDAATTVRAGIRVEEIIAGGQAERDGVIRVGDVIIAVATDSGGEATPLTGLHLAEVQRMFWGPDGTSVRLRILRGGGTNPIDVVALRGRVKSVRN